MQRKRWWWLGLGIGLGLVTVLALLRDRRPRTSIAPASANADDAAGGAAFWPMKEASSVRKATAVAASALLLTVVVTVALVGLQRSTWALNGGVTIPVAVLSSVRSARDDLVGDGEAVGQSNGSTVPCSLMPTAPTC